MPRRSATDAQVQAGQRLAELLSNERRQSGSSAENLARRADLSVETIRKIERGLVSNPGFFTVASMAKALGLRLDQLSTEALAQPEDTE